MRFIQQDLRRYAWCQGQMLYDFGVLAISFEEDLEGAVDMADPAHMVRVARDLGQQAAALWLLSENHARPLPPPTHRAVAGLAVLPADLVEDVRLLLNGNDDDPESVVLAARRVMEAMRRHFGDAPNVLTEDGYGPAIAFATTWIELLGEIGESLDFL